MGVAEYYDNLNYMMIQHLSRIVNVYLKEFEAWLAELKAPITVNLYDMISGEVIGEMTFGK